MGAGSPWPPKKEKKGHPWEYNAQDTCIDTKGVAVRKKIKRPNQCTWRRRTTGVQTIWCMRVADREERLRAGRAGRLVSAGFLSFWGPLAPLLYTRKTGSSVHQGCNLLYSLGRLPCLHWLTVVSWSFGNSREVSSECLWKRWWLCECGRGGGYESRFCGIFLPLVKWRQDWGSLEYQRWWLPADRL